MERLSETSRRSIVEIGEDRMNRIKARLESIKDECGTDVILENHQHTKIVLHFRYKELIGFSYHEYMRETESYWIDTPKVKDLEVLSYLLIDRLARFSGVV